MNNSHIPPKKMVLINDLTGYGRCSLAVALPVVSVLGIQACPVPTAVFSNHMAFPVWFKDDYTSRLQEYLSCWEKLNLSFDGIYCGFLGNEKQADILSDFIEKQKQANQSLFILDPVMGDHGKLYSSVTSSYFSAIKALLPYSDILTPNLTEACFLTETSYPDQMPDLAFLADMTAKLHSLGPAKIVITGLYDNGYFHNYVSELGEEPGLCTSKAGGPSRPGTGDLFASIVAAEALNHKPFYDSVTKAAEFVRICTKDSAACSMPINDGVCFEKNLHYLIQK